jgi:hypothetical protein
MVEADGEQQGNLVKWTDLMGRLGVPAAEAEAES